MRGKPNDGSKNPGGRPRKHWHLAPPEVIGQKVFDLAVMSLSGEEISSFLGFTRENLYKTYGSQLEKGHQECNASLRRKQFELAMKGNPTMLIWLGKQRLGQRDKHEHSGPDGKPIPLSLEGAQAALADLLASVRQRSEEQESSETIQ